MSGVCGVLTAALLAGRSDTRKEALLWSSGGVLWSLAAAVTVFFMKSAVREIALQRMPGMADVHRLIPEIAIPDTLMFYFGAWTLVSAVTVFLLVFNCRRNSGKWYWAVLWSIGLTFFFGHLVFMPYFYGVATWLTLIGVQKGVDFFQPVNATLPAGCAMLLISLAAVALWTWYTVKKDKSSWKNILIFSGVCTGAIGILWLSAWGVGIWAAKEVDRKAAELEITPWQVADSEPPGLKNPELDNFYTRHVKYNPPRSGRYNWSRNEIPAEEKEYTLKFFDSPELEAYLELLTESSAYLKQKDAIYFSALQLYRSLVRHRADKAELYYRSGRIDKVVPELLKYPELETLIPADTPFLLHELVRTATRWLWVEAVVQYAPDDKKYSGTYRKLLEWSRTWQVHVPHEAGFYLNMHMAPSIKGAVKIFYAPLENAVRYRGFSDAVKRMPELEKLQKMEVFSRHDLFSKNAATQQQVIALGRTALALKLYRVQHGKYPEKLSELVPVYLPKVYRSAWSGKEFIYTVKDGNFTLTSDKRSISSQR